MDPERVQMAETADHYAAKAARLEAALREIDTAANWVGRRNAWNRSLRRVGQPPTADTACREVRHIVRSALEGKD